MSHEISGISTCRICGWKIAGPQGAASVIYQPKGSQNRLANFLAKVADHMIATHPDETRMLQVKGQEFFGMLLLMQYDSSDSLTQEELEFLRWSIHRTTRKAHISDETLAQTAEKLADLVLETVIPNLLTGTEQLAAAQVIGSVRAKVSNQVQEILSGMRDLYEESNPAKLSERQLEVIRGEAARSTPTPETTVQTAPSA